MYSTLSRTTMRATLAAMAVALAAVAIPHASGPAFAREAPVYTGLVKGVAVGGYDPVAYFAEGKPVAGSDRITATHDGATWRFASEQNKAAFLAEPARYAPQYGGYCAWAVSQGYTAKGDPNAWTIHGGKLYLNYDKKVQATWERNKPANIAKADANWPGVLAK
jgi:YHS domain-containing protein